MGRFLNIVSKGTTYPVRVGAVDEDAARERAKEEPERPYQGVVDFQGIPVHLENKRGSVRRGEGWATKMRHHYGEVRGTKGADGDPIDCYVGPNHDSPLVVVVRQKVPGSKVYDEDKVMLGFDSVHNALTEYRRHYDRPGFYGGHKTTTVPAFKRWLDGPGANDQRTSFKAIIADMMKAAPPGGGWEPIQEGRHGGYRKREGTHYVYWYPSAQHSLKAGNLHASEAKRFRQRLSAVAAGKKKLSESQYKQLLDRYEHHASQAEAAYLHHMHTKGQAAGKVAREQDVRAQAREKMQTAYSGGVTAGKQGAEGPATVRTPTKEAMQPKQERLTPEQVEEAKAGKLGTKAELDEAITKTQALREQVAGNPLASAKVDEALKHMKEAQQHAPEEKPKAEAAPAVAPAGAAPTSPEELAKHPAVQKMIQQAVDKAVKEATEKQAAAVKVKQEVAEQKKQTAEKTAKFSDLSPQQVSDRWLEKYPVAPDHPEWKKLHDKAKAGKLTAKDVVHAGMERVLGEKAKKKPKGKERKASEGYTATEKEQRASAAKKYGVPEGALVQTGDLGWVPVRFKKAIEIERSAKRMCNMIAMDQLNKAQRTTKTFVQLPEHVGRWLFKGANHKYIKRVPKAGGGYKYFYAVQHGGGIASTEHFQTGAAFKYKEGHYHVTGTQGDQVTIRHDETGETKTVSKQKLSNLLGVEHGGAIKEHQRKVRRDLEQARKTGNKAQIARMEALARKHGVGTYENATVKVEAGGDQDRFARLKAKVGERVVEREKSGAPITKKEKPDKFARLKAEVEKRVQAGGKPADAVSGTASAVEKVKAHRDYAKKLEQAGAKDAAAEHRAHAERIEKEAEPEKKPAEKPASSTTPAGFEAAVKAAIAKHGSDLPAIRRELQAKHGSYLDTTAGRLALDRIRRESKADTHPDVEAARKAYEHAQKQSEESWSAAGHERMRGEYGQRTDVASKAKQAQKDLKVLNEAYANYGEVLKKHDVYHSEHNPQGSKGRPSKQQKGLGQFSALVRNL